MLVWAILEEFFKVNRVVGEGEVGGRGILPWFAVYFMEGGGGEKIHLEHQGKLPKNAR